MEIVQLSDIHVGSQFREDIFEKAIDEIEKIAIEKFNDNTSISTIFKIGIPNKIV